ncbi:hypothetical protein PHLGIDRAFT_412565 [Phlebiopsis gigantea 11061_1 CR5-6]|uniref:Uncharacterized protein n=1 Tax=Phlebiopsis gigantea (strain 11061_1 CR5-6) TaxID=745531 RepID=A0A0C3SB31_PHLG1|nr:hypothetical protein PHLGIDRAFT_412565 [Phlebiopsis gigantea 11061_1 CR5-6]
MAKAASITHGSGGDNSPRLYAVPISSIPVGVEAARSDHQTFPSPPSPSPPSRLRSSRGESRTAHHPSRCWARDTSKGERRRWALRQAAGLLRVMQIGDKTRVQRDTGQGRCQWALRCETQSGSQVRDETSASSRSLSHSVVVCCGMLYPNSVSELVG